MIFVQEVLVNQYTFFFSFNFYFWNPIIITCPCLFITPFIIIDFFQVDINRPHSWGFLRVKNRSPGKQTCHERKERITEGSWYF